MVGLARLAGVGGDIGLKNVSRVRFAMLCFE